MTTEQEQAVRTLRIIRYSPKRGRHFGITAIARASGYSTEALYAVVRRGWCSKPMAERLANVFAKPSIFQAATPRFRGLGAVSVPSTPARTRAVARDRHADLMTGGYD